MATTHRRTGDTGFTLVEVMVTIALAGVLMGVVVSGWSRWAGANAFSGAVVEVQDVLRSAQQRAVTDGSRVCVILDADADTYTVRRDSCASTAERLRGPVALDSRVNLQQAVRAGSTTAITGFTFLPRGDVLEGGKVTLSRDGDAGTTRTITVAQLTGRVATD